MTTLILAEKPSAAKHIASAISLNKQKEISDSKVKFYTFELNNKKYVVVSAVGHLYSLKAKRGQNYPVLQYDWAPVYETSKNSAFAKKYLTVIKKQAKNATNFIIATDDDIEGSLIGWNCMRFLCGVKDGMRMKFSTMTADDLQESFKTAQKHFDFSQISAGITRHELDFIYGLSLSKAVVSAVSQAKNRYIQLSIGRVQGPALALLAEREKEIQKFKPVPYWQIFADVKLKTSVFEAVHAEDRFWDEKKAKAIFQKIRDKPAKVEDIRKARQAVLPPFPFDLTSLQIEAYRCFRISPKRTLSAAQELYTNAMISYPRTSSQKLPQKLGFKKIITKLAKNRNYSKTAKQVLKTKLLPNEGRKTDPAHPAIYPTGAFARGLDGDAAKIYDLIVKRFFSVFGEPGEREGTQAKFSIADEPFLMNGIRTTKLGWQEWYMPYANKKELELPALKPGEVYSEKSRFKKDETKPPARYSPASIIKQLEKENLGTKATRANIIEILRERGYIQGTPIEVTELGLKVIDTFEKHAPSILSKELTRKFEEEMEKVQENKKKPDDVLDEASKIIIKICKELDANKKEIGEVLGEAFTETEKQKNTLCKCPKCGKGDMRIIFSRKTGKRFLACNQYPKCQTTWGMPQKGLVSIQKNTCKCGTPITVFYTRGRRPWILCLNPDCKYKEKIEDKKDTKTNKSS